MIIKYKDTYKEMLVDDKYKDGLKGKGMFLFKVKGDNVFYAKFDLDKKRTSVHRYIYQKENPLENIEDKQIDHINGNSLDNRIKNLRAVSQSVNKSNWHKRMKGDNKYVGVTKNLSDTTNTKPFKASLKYNGKRRHLLISNNEYDCAIAYDVAVILLKDEIASTNFNRGEIISISNGFIAYFHNWRIHNVKFCDNFYNLVKKEVNVDEKMLVA
ncbi:HNH endonuclease [Kiritimatiellaeota bacterium B1221]|nr:HNH endonuclease [Kiritimatiellaeota bacterium B1221]